MKLRLPKEYAGTDLSSSRPADLWEQLRGLDSPPTNLLLVPTLSTSALQTGVRTSLNNPAPKKEEAWAPTVASVSSSSLDVTLQEGKKS